MLRDRQGEDILDPADRRRIVAGGNIEPETFRRYPTQLGTTVIPQIKIKEIPEWNAKEHPHHPA
jgi:hypothetical protein